MRKQLRRHAPGLVLILVVAVGLRVLWVLLVHPDPLDGRFDDTVWYRAAAHFVANGRGYANPYTGTPTAQWPPGYPIFLGLVFSWIGEGLAQTYGVNITLQAATIAVGYCIGLKLFDRRTALFAAVALAVWPGQIYFSSLTLSEPLFTFLFSLGVLFIVLIPDAGRWRGPLLLVFGFVAAIAALTRGQGLLLAPFALLAWGLAGYRWRPALSWALMSVVVMAVVVAPWVARNQRKLGSPVLISTNAGGDLWIGNHDGATGKMNIRQRQTPQPPRGTLTQGEFEVEADRLALRKALGYMATHPIDEVSLALSKIRALYASDATGLDWNSGYEQGFYTSQAAEDWLRGGANGFWFTALLLAAFAIVPLRARLTSDMSGLLPAMVLVWTASHVVFFGEARFHYPIVFALALLSARGAIALAEAVRLPHSSMAGRYAAYVRADPPQRGEPRLADDRPQIRAVVATALILLATAAGIGAAMRLRGDNRVSGVRLVSDGSSVPGASSTFTRSESGAALTFRASGLPAGHIVTLKAVIFNQPTNCQHGIGGLRCGDDDLANPEVEGSVVYLTAVYLRTSAPTVDLQGSLVTGDKGRALLGDGLTNPLRADVHLVVLDHGPPIAALYGEMLSTLGAGCKDAPPGSGTPGPNACADIQISAHEQ